MSLMCEIEKFMNNADASINFRIINIGGNVLYVEGVKNVVEFGSETIKIQLKKALLEITGENLKTSYLDKTTCVIKGKIISVVTKWNLI